MEEVSPLLTVIVTSHSDPDVYNTVASIRQTAPEAAITVVDDHSAKPVTGLEADVIRTPRRIGVGPARTLGAIHAKGKWLLLVDAHMRFTPGWYQNLIAHVAPPQSECTLFCGTCLGLDDANMDVTKPKGVYHGATWQFYGRDANAPSKMQILECVWNRGPEPANGSIIPAVMGACYAVNRRKFLDLMPLRFLRSYGVDEQALSLKFWLGGDGIKLMTDVRIGHKFRTPKNLVPFPLKGWQTIFNKLFIIHTCLPPDKALILQNKFPRGGEFQMALSKLYEDWHLIAYEQARNADVLKSRTFDDFLSKFQLPFPAK